MQAACKLSADFDAKTHFTTLTPGQFDFVEGIYVGSPATPDGLPPGDGALLATHSGTKNGIFFGPTARSREAAPNQPELIKLIADIKTGALDAEGDEL